MDYFVDPIAESRHKRWLSERDWIVSQIKQDGAEYSLFLIEGKGKEKHLVSSDSPINIAESYMMEKDNHIEIRRNGVKVLATTKKTNHYV